MRMYDIILKKRQGLELSTEEINFFIRGYTAGEIPDYQAAALLMAIFFQGLNFRETADLTVAMAGSGDQVDLSGIPGCKVDKHSTGGVGDKTTLVLAPLVAAAGVPVAKMSGRGLGHTGGTVDKLESIPGFKVNLSPDDFIRQVREIGVAIVAQTGNLVPADKKLYALRDVTATVDSIPLIASSVMSKKIAAGADAIVLDVKTGNGAFMRSVEDASALARTMVAIGRLAGKKVVALISDMEQPLGFAAGNALEVREAIETLSGRGPSDLRELCLLLGSHMLVLAGVTSRVEDGIKLLTGLLERGHALAKFREMVQAQGGDPRVVDEPDRLPEALQKEQVTAQENGFVVAIHAGMIGRAAMLLGAGRKTREDTIDPAVGVVVHKKVGDRVGRGDALATLHINSRENLALVRQLVAGAFHLSTAAPPARELVYSVIGYGDNDTDINQ
ncbi:pyrimidine-nucleoside phosphorylase [Desulfofundulus thermocisternus]|uniref:pyrimidine-nucleoside phosphorylase n=1 Tax=Desulfofundulus thermocisternus TaxID=42471 RepID=UPI001A0EF69B|nr:pyrimidine-nucleoside phosphorylase [Desulfofundulus thermocisternus]MBE3584655.1 pyrimidine-nucleoside phosphorylase [Thermoanaerobacter sp.]MCS5694750.1 pyrimidine-nucleoside phosphorylase [Desulfofundulus thermocisternus]